MITGAGRVGRMEKTPDKHEWKPLDGYPWVKYRGDVWEMEFLCACGAHLTFSGTDAMRRGKMHIKGWHMKCNPKGEDHSPQLL